MDIEKQLYNKFVEIQNGNSFIELELLETELTI